MKKNLLLISSLLLLSIVGRAQTWVTQDDNFVANAGVNDIEVVDESTVWITNYDGSGGNINLIGFGKTIDHNYELLSRLGDFSITGLPVVAGLSRKSMIWKTLNIDAEAALNGTTALNTLALLNGADILRVHDVKEAREVIVMAQCLNDSRR